MSFADPSLPRTGRPRAGTPSAADGGDSKSLRASQRPGRGREDEETPAVERPRGSSYRRSVDWEHVRLVGAGLLIGAVVGAGAALLLAPSSGQEARTAIRRGARVARHRAGDAWGDLAAELADVARRGRRRARRAMRRARLRASDALV
jgi:hypothetical protein